MRGRPPKPTVTKILTGTFRKGRQNTREAKPGPGAPSCPEFLDATAKAEWQRIAPELDRLGLLTGIDRAALAGYCSLWARWQAAEAVIQRDGMTFETPNGFIQKNPAVTIARESLALLRNFSSEFGLSPASRSKVQAGPPARTEEEQALDEFFPPDIYGRTT